MEDIEGLVQRHDDYQFEIKLDYDLTGDRDRYKVETYFFLPNNLGINESTYTKRQFYRDLHLYLRFKAPEFSLEALNDPSNDRSPLSRLSVKLDQLLAEPSPSRAASLEYEIKIFGCTLKSSLRGQALSVEHRAAEATAEGLAAYADGARRAVAGYRALRDRFGDPSVPKHVRSAYNYTDEYVSLLIEGSAHQLLQFLGSHHGLPGGERAAAALTGIIREETEHRKGLGYPSLAREDGDNETFVFRMSVLKKFVSSILHLSVRTQEEGRGLEQLALAVGAGVAMVFASAIAFYYQKTYGTVSLSFFIALVISYMFKDRIKALSQGYFQRVIERRIFDHATAIYDPHTREKIGICRESVHFAPESAIDREARRLRDRDHMTEIENDWRSETVIYYLKEVLLNPRALLRSHSRKTAVADIVRFSVRNFLARMDEPVTDVFVLKEGRSLRVPAARTYHVNVVIKFTSRKEVRYDRIRLILTRRGIKRVEPLSRETVTPL